MEGQRPSRHTPLQTKEAWGRLIGTSENLKVLGSLSDGEAGRVAEAVELLKSGQTPEKQRKYKRFLQDVLRNSGPQAVLICAVALGQVKVVNMKNDNRVELVREIQNNKDHTDINHPTLQSLATSYQIPNSVNDVSPLTHKVVKRRRRDSAGNSTPLQLEQLPTVQAAREIDYRCSEAPISRIPLLGDLLLEAVQSSYQWEWERTLGGRSTTDCLNALVPENRSQDISITLLVGHDKGLELIEKFQLATIGG